MFQCGTVGGDFALRSGHVWTQVPSTVFLNLESTGGSLDVIQGVRELGCCLRVGSLEAENEMEISCTWLMREHSPERGECKSRIGWRSS